MSTRDPIDALLADLKTVPPAALPARVAESRAAAADAIDALPDGPCHTALVAWLATVDAECQEWLRVTAASYGRVWIAASTAYQPPAAPVRETPVEPARAPEPAPLPAPVIGDPRDARHANPTPPRPGVRLPPKVRTAPPAAPQQPRALPRVPQGRPPYVPTRDRPVQSPHRPLAPAPDDDDIPF